MRLNKKILTLITAVTVGMTAFPMSVSARTISRTDENTKPTIEEKVDTKVDTTITTETTETVIKDDKSETTITETTTTTTTTTTTDTTIKFVGNADIVFIVDSTGSMWDEIQNVKNNLEIFSKYLEDRGVGLRMSVIEYRDTTYDGLNSTIIHKLNYTPWCNTTEQLKNILSKIDVDGGGDIPETALDAMGYLLKDDEIMFSSGAHKFAILLSDVNSKEDNRHGLTWDKFINKLVENKINTSVITTPYYYSEYENMVNKTGGKLADIGSDFAKILEELANSIFEVVKDTKIDETIVSVKDVKIKSEGKDTIKVGETTELNAVFTPANPTNKKLKWNVEDDSIVSISAKGVTCKIKGLKKGATKITAVSEDGGFVGSYTITVKSSGQDQGKNNGIIVDNNGDTSSDEMSAIGINVDEICITPAKKTISKGNKFNIKPSIVKDAQNGLSKEEMSELLDESIDSIVYRSTKSSVAGVTKKGKVVGIKKGSAIIKTTITLADGSERTYKTKVYVK